MKKNIFVSNLKFQALGFVFKSNIFLHICLLFFLFLSNSVFAKEVNILYTGDTHAMLYPCDCPLEPDGGVARRATLIKQLRKENSNTLVLDSGGFFAGGLMDAYTLNTQLDMLRTNINLKAMELMQYDAVTIGDDEFNFGREFLEENIAKYKIAFLSCNIKSPKILPYIIKDVGGTKFGIIGITGLFARQKADKLEFIESKVAVKQAVQDLKNKGANIIVLLSHQGENDDLNLIKDISGIDIIITGHRHKNEGPKSEIGSILILRPSWQGRHLGKLSLTIENNKIVKHKVDELRLSDKIADDKEILSILPSCFSDHDCKREGYIGVCKDAASMKSRCEFTKVSKINLTVITSRDCIVCKTEQFVDSLKRQVPGLTSSYLYYPEAKAKKLIKDFNLKGLPVYMLGKEIEKEKVFESLRRNLEKKGDFYIFKPEFAGLSYFIDREKIKGKLDLFISLYDKNAKGILDVIREFNPSVNFLTVEEGDGFSAAMGKPEVEEYLRAVCVQKYYPQNFWDYISCRAANIDSSWWEDCLDKLDSNRIKVCAKSGEAKALLRERLTLNKELQIMYGPAYLLDNQQIFSSIGVPDREELRKIIGKNLSEK